jgi:NAD(P)-dependent dehydrogenase (short-subunit alcohol dehydrogenase family)/2,4-dienoyl-CoA reductase-like NADH-dependent reductase (Old Yellow Enzyme family)
MNNWKFKLTDVNEFKSLCDQLGCQIDAVEDVSILAEPVKVGRLLIPNSLAVHPMEGADGDSFGRPSELTMRRYKRFAAGGAGLLWAEAIAVVPEGRANSRQLWLNEQSKDDFAQMVKMMRAAAKQSMGEKHNPVIVAQLTHSGRYSKPAGTASPMIPQRDSYRDSLVPESKPNTNKQSKVADNNIVSDDYLDNLQLAYVKAARLAYEAGFDAIDIKSCHGYLINELLASRSRTGKYGGSFENRTRFLLEVIDKIKAELDDEIEICLRLGFYDAIPFPYGWGVDENDYTKPDLTEPKKLVKLLMDRGVRLINFTIANPYYNPHVGRPFNQPIKGAYESPEHPLRGVERLINLAGGIQNEFPDAAIVGTGYSWLRELMGNVAAASKQNGKAKIIGAGRMAFAYPDFAKDLLTKGKLDKNKVCVGCSECTQLMRDGQTAGCVLRDSEAYGLISERHKMSDKPVAVVTGASRGIGKAIAVELAGLGYNIVINYFDFKDGQPDDSAALQTQKEITGCKIFRGDISKAEDRKQLVEFVKKNFGRCDMLVNNAGVAPAKRVDILEATEDSFDRVMNINLKGPYFLTQLVANWMIEQKKQNPERNFRICSTGSMSAYTSSPARGEYCISKAGIGMMTMLYADRLAEFNIGVFEIRPGIIMTDMTSVVKEKYDKLIAEGITPIKRWGLPEDVAKAVGAIAEGRLDFSTGQVINVDGGFHFRRL